MSSSYPQTDEQISYLNLKIWNWDFIMLTKKAGTAATRSNFLLFTWSYPSSKFSSWGKKFVSLFGDMMKTSLLSGKKQPLSKKSFNGRGESSAAQSTLECRTIVLPLTLVTICNGTMAETIHLPGIRHIFSDFLDCCMVLNKVCPLEMSQGNLLRGIDNKKNLKVKREKNCY